MKHEKRKFGQLTDCCAHWSSRRGAPESIEESCWGAESTRSAPAGVTVFLYKHTQYRRVESGGECALRVCAPLFPPTHYLV